LAGYKIQDTNNFQNTRYKIQDTNNFQNTRYNFRKLDYWGSLKINFEVIKGKKVKNKKTKFTNVTALPP